MLPLRYGLWAPILSRLTGEAPILKRCRPPGRNWTWCSAAPAPKRYRCEAAARPLHPWTCRHGPSFWPHGGANRCRHGRTKLGNGHKSSSCGISVLISVSFAATVSVDFEPGAACYSHMKYFINLGYSLCICKKLCKFRPFRNLCQRP